MCRLIAYQGALPERLDAFLLRAPHALSKQALAPREMSPSLPSADGWGMVWYTPDAEEPARYRTTIPMWRDENLEGMTPHLRATSFVAATRVATGAERAIVNNQPFTSDRFAFVHNGAIDDFEAKLLKPIREGLSARRATTARGLTDSEHLFALFLDEEPRGGATEMVAALQRVVQKVASLAKRFETSATMNLVVCDGRNIVALRYATKGKKAPSLYVLRAPGAFHVASEPPNDEAWKTVKPGTFVGSHSENDEAVADEA